MLLHIHALFFHIMHDLGMFPSNLYSKWLVSLSCLLELQLIERSILSWNNYLLQMLRLDSKLLSYFHEILCTSSILTKNLRHLHNNSSLINWIICGPRKRYDMVLSKSWEVPCHRWDDFVTLHIKRCYRWVAGGQLSIARMFEGARLRVYNSVEDTRRRMVAVNDSVKGMEGRWRQTGSKWQ